MNVYFMVAYKGGNFRAYEVSDSVRIRLKNFGDEVLRDFPKNSTITVEINGRVAIDPHKTSQPQI